MYWDKRAWALSPGDLTMATRTHWLLAPTMTSTYAFSVPVPHSRKRPLEGRVWYAYPGQTNLRNVGWWIQPSRVGRVLDDGSSQITETSYNTKGWALSTSDPPAASATACPHPEPRRRGTAWRHDWRRVYRAAR